jgi:hypothetical protein
VCDDGGGMRTSFVLRRMHDDVCTVPSSVTGKLLRLMLLILKPLMVVMLHRFEHLYAYIIYVYGRHIRK